MTAGGRRRRWAAVASVLVWLVAMPWPAGATGANVECIRQGDKVVKLIVTCSCGEKIEIDCVYPAAG